MELLKRAKYILLAALFALTFVGCAGDSKAPVDNPSSEVTDNKEHRPMFEKEEKVTYEDNDHLFDYKEETWDGPNGYVIVVPAGNADAKKSAGLLKDYYSEVLKVDLSIVTDNTKETDKEILIGNTKRSESVKDLDEGKISVSVKGKKLVFCAGHNVSLDSAVKKYIRLAPNQGKAFTFELDTDFKSELQGDHAGYKYVWGDEFEGNGVDFSKWDFITKMVGNDVVELSYEKNVVDVADGRLKLHALSYFNNNRKGTEYRIPGSVITQNKMNFVYGYLEIRSRVPYSPGVWASFWTQSTDALKGSRNYDYMLEVDIYEIFRTYGKHPNLIHWYPASFDYNARYEPNKTPGVAVSHSIYPVGANLDVYWFDKSDKLNYEYHTYAYEWTPTEIKMYVDDECHVTYDITKAFFDKHQDMSSYHDPQHVIFNNHVFYPGISEACVSIALHPESLPACHYIDYIRLYQKPGQGELYTAD